MCFPIPSYGYNVRPIDCQEVIIQLGSIFHRTSFICLKHPFSFTCWSVIDSILLGPILGLISLNPPLLTHKFFFCLTGSNCSNLYASVSVPIQAL